MTMLAILLAYLLERFLNDIDRYRTYQWFNQFIDWTRNKFELKNYWNDTAGMLIMILIPVSIVALVHDQLSEIHITFDFIFGVVILLYCFGPKDLHEATRQFIHAIQRDDQQRAREFAAGILDDQVPEDDSRLFTEISHSVLIATNNRILGVFFWFVILGPMGAILYRLSSVFFSDTRTKNDNESLLHSASLLFAILNWLPAHLTALCYGIIGSFIDAHREWTKHKSADPFSLNQCNTMLVMTGLGSMRMDADSVRFDETSLKNILEMSSRTIMVWLTVLALITMAGWAS